MVLNEKQSEASYHSKGELLTDVNFDIRDSIMKHLQQNVLVTCTVFYRALIFCFTEYFVRVFSSWITWAINIQYNTIQLTVSFGLC